MGSLFKGFERIEEARDRLSGRSFMAGLFAGRPDFPLLLLPEESPAETEVWESYRPRLETFLTTQVDPDEIERTAKIPDAVLQGLFAIGAFGMKIPKEYGGLGFSYTNYGRALMLIASWSNVLALTVAVPQSIGIAMPVLLFGTEEQKRKYLPLVAREAISAFALTESVTGSDAANVQTDAVLDSGGMAYRLSGEKLWCTNGTIARYITLIARVPARRELCDGRTVWVPVPEGKEAEDRVHTAFILDMDLPGVRVRQRCQFEGCRGIENAYMTFRNVRIPAANVIGDVGRGLKYALTILNVGRAISIPAICLGMAKQAWQPTLDRANDRVTFQRPLAERQTQRMRVGRMAADLFAMEALAFSVWRMADRRDYDVRIESAIAKICCSERTIRFLKDAQTIFGGMGYETADSKRVRGEPAFGIEQLVRDAEMYRIGEGATDILRPFVAREALDPHLERARTYLEEEPIGLRRLVKLGSLAAFYIPWYLRQWIPSPLPSRPEFRHPNVRPKLRFVERASRRLARAMFYSVAWHRQALRDDQGRQNRIESIGEDLAAIAITGLYAEAQRGTAGYVEAWDLADEVFREAKVRVKRQIRALISNRDARSAGLGVKTLGGACPALSAGIIARGLRDYQMPEKDAVGTGEGRKQAAV
ncbi:putative Acyl-CoA dehydrogenase [Nitrospira japonica]|uniref:Putative Acyl-CoA dehydrogenase n=1 Tax=Nitrospira japonica TaxID=1325564 RepID=A0A1W1I138_9BACT|nr:acyl-CoA dehydrogenase family protein [Nitrospira japonica]SLM46707.1 putative Acyl-CoA dehydrogenase [Nitrospira japonica]